MRRKPLRAAEFASSVGKPIEVAPPGVFEAGSKHPGPPPGVVTELKANGLPINGISDLVNNRVKYDSSVLPILLKWLPRVEDNDLREDIVRALTVKWARPAAAKPLIKEFKKSTDPSWSGLQWAIGNALTVVADDTVYDDVVHLLRSRKYGRAREMLPLALVNMKRPDSIDVLIEALRDDDLAVQARAIKALGILRASKARSVIKPFAERPESAIRNEARKALERIARAQVSNR